MEDKGDYFSLKWSNFQSSFSEGFHDFLLEEAMVDVTLAVEGKFVQAHKLVLSVCSPYFKNLFKVNPCKHPIVILKDVCHSDLSYMLDFMYKGEVGVKHEDLPSFLKLAETLKVKGLAGEKIEKNDKLSSKHLDSNLARVRKKLNTDSVSDVNKENNDFQSCNEQSRKKIVKNRKRRFSCKTESVKKFKSEKCEDSSASNCVGKNSDSLSEDEDNNPLIKFIGDGGVKSGENSKSESHCDNENESQCDNKTSFSGWSDGVPDSDDSGGPDINSLFQSDYSEETDETPQDIYLFQADLRCSPVWYYYNRVENNMAVCRICRKNLRKMQTTQAEHHLRAKHPKEASIFLKLKAKWLRGKQKRSSR